MRPAKNKKELFSFYTFSFSYGNLEEGLKQIITSVKSEYILKQTFFYSPHIKKKELADIIKKVHNRMPATSLICQPLADDVDVGVELWVSDFRVQHISDNISVCDISGSRWIFIGGVESDPAFVFHRQVDSVLRKAHNELRKIGFGFQHLIRTWYYIGGILEKEEKITRYELLNSIRNKFYDLVWEKKKYPASTGIGMHGNRIALDGIALIPSAETKIVRIENPLQVSAFDYNIPFERRPRFCRAIYVEDKDLKIIFVSGTASIRGGDVVYSDDIEAQTYTTVENIKKLISQENLKHYGIIWSDALNNVKSIRVYIKNRSDYPKVREICEKSFKDIPKLYLIADICKASLLVEIEAVIIKSSA